MSELVHVYLRIRKDCVSVCLQLDVRHVQGLRYVTQGSKAPSGLSVSLVLPRLHTCGGWGRGRGQKASSRLHAEHQAGPGLDLMPEVMV